MLFTVDAQTIRMYPEVHTGWGMWAPGLGMERSTLDFRGVGFLAGSLNGLACAVGFLHNRYTDEAIRTLVLSQVPRYLVPIRQQSELAPGAPVFLGGEFSRPPEKRGTLRTGVPDALAVGLLPADCPPAAKPDGTTRSGNLHDYWYTTAAPTDPTPTGFATPHPGVFVATMGDDGSDHALVTLTVT